MTRGSARRKTFDVQQFKAEINRQIAMQHLSVEARRAMCNVLEQVLMETNNYQGFNWVYWLERGCNDWQSIGGDEVNTPELAERSGISKAPFIYGTADGTDNYRRVYY